LSDLTLIILNAGSSSRFKSSVKKQWLYIEDRPLWKVVADRFANEFNFSKIIITTTKEEFSYIQRFGTYEYIVGGDSRQKSLKNALNMVESAYVLVTDVARACIPTSMIQEIIDAKKRADIIVPILNVHDTVIFNNETIDRDRVKLVQTPQLSKTDILKKALENETIYTDDSSLIKAVGGSVFYTKGSTLAKKITSIDDIRELKCLKPPKNIFFTGLGYDVHKFCKDRDMFLCGVKIDSEYGFEAHSDGDVAIHALIDSILGGIGAGDIGELFPDNSEEFKDIDSKILLKRVIRFVRSVGFDLVNCDITIIAQKPKLSYYKKEMCSLLADILQIEPIRVNVKATTTEKLGFVGRSEGVAVKAISQLKLYNWDEYEDINS
jgi:2-C-methyl-D-erythritol 4-phosphate cytidylyltransferase/2-C-methyl-D-erythritol 2,4-cyclodiphosphate synthase